MDLLEAAAAAKKDGAGRKKRRGTGHQRRRREAERRVRKNAVAYRRWVVVRGGTRREAAKAVGVPERTLMQWERDWEDDRLEAKARGRRLERLEPEDRRLMIALLVLLGPKVGVKPLRRCLKGVARGEIIDLHERCRRVYEKLNRVVVHKLTWTRPGSVWAMDHTWPPGLIDGAVTPVLAVKDLSSGNTLGFMPRDETAEAVIAALGKLIAEHGAPLALKADNGSSFVAKETRRFLAARGVQLLLSPPRTARYNGSVESSHRHLKDKAAHIASICGRSGDWTREDLEAARLLENALCFPRGHGCRSADEVWRDRAPITVDERDSFNQSVIHEENLELSARGGEPGQKLGRRVLAEVKRTAIGRALVAGGFLLVRRRSIPLPFNSKLRAKIS